MYIGYVVYLFGGGGGSVKVLLYLIVVVCYLVRTDHEMVFGVHHYIFCNGICVVSYWVCDVGGSCIVYSSDSWFVYCYWCVYGLFKYQTKIIARITK